MVELTQFIPGLLAATVFGLLTGPSAARRLGVGRLLGTAVMISLAVIPATTLTPGGEIPSPGLEFGTCDFTRFGPPSVTDLLTINDISLNVLLFVPIGLTLGLLPRSRGKWIAIGAVAVLPIAVETIQLVVIPLARYCDSADVADNLTGLVIGLVLGFGIGALAGVVNGHRHRRI